MRVLVAGATSVPGVPLVRLLNEQGHDVVGLTRSASNAAAIKESGAEPVIADVFDVVQIDGALAEHAPDVVISLLTTLPKWGPKRPKDFRAATKLWSDGVPNLIAAAQRAKVRRIVAESVIFAYGYGSCGPALMDESTPYPGPPPPGGTKFLGALRDMERTVLSSSKCSDTEGIVLRYGVFHGPGVSHDVLLTRLAAFWMLPAMTGPGMLSWVHIDDVARATAEAMTRGRDGEIYNIVDDRPRSFAQYVRELNTELHRPRPWPISSRLVGLFASYPATAFGRTWLPMSNAKAKAELGWEPTGNPTRQY